MKIIVQTKKDIKEIEVKILSPKMDNDVERIVSMLNTFDKQLIVKDNNETFIINRDDLFYIDSVDKKTFVYTKDKVYESPLKLYELEDEFDFFRASKSCVINVRHIKSLKSEFNRKIRVTLTSGEQIIVSRQYAEDLKKKLGVK